MITLLYAYGIMCLISAIMFAFAIKNAEYHPDEKGEEDAEFIKQIEEYKKRQEK
jgi:hypothetical protein